MAKKGVSSLERQRQKTTRVAATVFLAPVFILMCIFILYPVIDTFRISMYEWNGIRADMTWNSFKNWTDLIVDGRFWTSFLNNVIIMVCSILLQLPIGLALATFIDAGGRKLNIFKIIWFLPLLMSSVAIGFLFQYALATNGGIISTISKWFGGGNVDLLGNPDRALYAVIGVMAWQFTPFYMVYFVAGYSGLSTEVYESSIIDGATRAQYFRSIALPLLKPTITAACTMSLIGSLKYFDLIYVMTGGGPGTATELMATYMYKMSFNQFQMGYGSSVAGGMFVLITAIALLFQRLFNGKKEDI